MRMKPHPKDDGYRVWMDGDELTQLIEKMHDRGGTMHRIAGRLGGHCGLRRDEASMSCPIDIVDSHGETVLRVWESQAKRDKYRETPIPQDLADQIRMIPEFRDQDMDDPTLDVTGKTLNRWVKGAAQELVADTGDKAWFEVTYHDLRRTWGTRMLEAGVLPSVVMWHGGWDDWQTFRKHYLGEFSPGALARERSKVEWLGGDVDAPEDIRAPVTTAAPPASNRGQWSD
jgi:integrase